ncbi:MAG: LacI family DNA-binding transcriptional regulator [Eubacterium sp.]|nr:LacI family DNA-binding transcriptional regulator [Eubacterium sp.]
MSEKRLKDVALAMGVSVVTVSNALSGRKGVSPATAEAIVDKAVELGVDLSRYRSRKNNSYTIGIFVSSRYISLGDSFYWKMYEKTAYAASRKHCFSMLEISDEESEKTPLPEMLRQQQIDGLIIIGRLQEDYMIKIIRHSSVPIVLLDVYSSTYHCSAVMSNNYYGMYRSTAYLIDHGHREIGFVGTGITSNNVIERFMGYRKCLMDYGLPFHPEYVVRDRDINERIILQLPDKLPTAFACSSDYAAQFLEMELSKRGLRIPDDISVTGYDNFLYKRAESIPYTTYNVDMEQMGRTAVKMLIRKIEGRDSTACAKYIDSTMIERSSVKTLLPKGEDHLA